MPIKEIIKNIGKFGSGLASGMTIHSWVKDIKNENALNSTVKDLVERDKFKEEMVRDLLEEKITNTVTQAKIKDVAESSRKSLERAMNSDKEISELTNKLSDGNLSATDKANLESQISTVKQTLNSSLQESSKIYEKIQKLLDNNKPSGSSGGTNMMSNLQELFNSAQSYIDNLTHYQKFAFIHISSSIFMLFCLFTLIAVFSGNQLINYFNLSSRFPRLEKYILLRQKFQYYHFISNSLFIFLTLLIIIGLNILALTSD